MSELYALGTFAEAADASWPGVVRDGRVLPLAKLIGDAPAELAEVFIRWERWGAAIDAAMDSAPADGWIKEDSLHIRLPFRPANLMGAGANYRKHVIDLMVDTGAGGYAELDVEERRRIATEEMDRRAASGKPYIWAGVVSAIKGARDTLVLPYDVTEPDWELELAVVIGKPAWRVPLDHTLEHVAGYTIVNDVTARELVTRPGGGPMGLDFFASKMSPGFKILGPYVTPARFLPDPQKAHIRLTLNGQTMQDEGTSDMIFGVARLIEFASAHVRLLPGDVIMTGSPSGNGTHYARYLRDGDVMRGEIDGIAGFQLTPCVREQQS